MTIKKTHGNDATTILIEGRVDTITSPELQTVVLATMQEANKVFLDFAEVQYISSAGLRVLLIGQKTAAAKGTPLVLTHVSETVMAVLCTVGFDSILTIEPNV